MRGLSTNSWRAPPKAIETFQTFRARMIAAPARTPAAAPAMPRRTPSTRKSERIRLGGGAGGAAGPLSRRPAAAVALQSLAQGTAHPRDLPEVPEPDRHLGGLLALHSQDFHPILEVDVTVAPAGAGGALEDPADQERLAVDGSVLVR